jgi:hypothetical protein
MTGIGFAFLALLWPQTTLAQVKLEYKFPEGKKLTYKSTVKSKHVLTVADQAYETEQDEVIVTSRTAGTKRDDSSLPIEEKVESVRADFSFPGGIKLTLDSTDPNLKVDEPALAFLAEVFKLAGESRYTVVLDEQKKVKAIEGAEKLLEKADKLSQQARETIRSRLEADKLKREFEQGHGNLPDVLARPGESWERTEVLDIGNGQTLTFRKKYEYVGTEKKGDKTLDKITSKVTDVDLKQEPDAPGQFKVLKGNMKVDSSDQSILFDREEGQLVSSTGKFRIKGDNMTFSIMGMELTGGQELSIETITERQPAGR